RIQYKDFACWQNRLLGEAGVGMTRQYWLDQFRGELPVLELPRSFPRPLVKTYHGGRVSTRISGAITRRLNALGQDHEASLFITLLATVYALLYKYTGQEDIIVGTPIAGRNHADLEGQIGFYVNTLALRTLFSGDASFASLLGQVKQTALGAYQHQHYPFDRLVDDLGLERDASRSPLFDVLVGWQNHHAEDETETSSGLAAQPYAVQMIRSPFDVSFQFQETGEDLLLDVDFSTDLFAPAHVEQWVKHYHTLLASILDHPEALLHALPYLEARERNQLLGEFNRTATPYDRHCPVTELFARRVAEAPSRVALVAGDQTFTFGELHELSDRIAACLLDNHRVTREPVAVMMGRSHLLVAAILGVLKAGAVYVPIDPGYPRERVDYMLTHSGARVVLVDASTAGYEGAPHAQRVAAEKAVQHRAGGVATQNGPLDAAYVIYTSGSTGAPKGVVISHGNLANFMTGMRAALPLGPTDHLLAVTSVSFDISLLELLWTLCSGILVTLKTDSQEVSRFDDYLAGEQPVRGLDFGLFFFSSGDYDEHADKYALLMESAVFADAHDFAAIWTPERHFHEFGGIYPNPVVTSAALAAVTRRIHIRSGSIVLPLHNVIRVAEDWAVVDNLSRGRVGLSAAPGWHANDFALAPEKFDDRYRLMFEGIDELKRLWGGGTVLRTNGKGQQVEIKTFPKPVQAALPLWITAGGASFETFRRAGAIGANILTHLLGQDVGELAAKIKVYHQALADNGYPPERANVTVMLHTYLGPDLAEVKAEVAGPFKAYLQSSIGLTGLAKGLSVQLDEQAHGDIVEELLELAFERYWQTSALLGTPESCEPIVRQLAGIGVTEIACLTDFGIPHDKVRESLARLSAFKNKYAGGRRQSVHAQPVTALQTTPSLLKLLVNDPGSRQFLASLRHLIIGGEALPEELLAALNTLTGAALYNVYGPTETTIWSTAGELSPGHPLTAGRPVANTQIYIVDKQAQPVPVGVEGEIWIGGDGVAAGYLNHPEATAEKFVPDPWGAHPEGTLYRTGDFGKWLPDGTIAIAGRHDGQVKIRGHRIEPGEIEAALKGHPGVREAVVLAAPDKHGDQQLTAYLVTRPGEAAGAGPDVAQPPGDARPDGAAPGEGALRNFLRRKLPAYMVPARFVVLAAMPLTPNGKTDKKALLKHLPVVRVPEGQAGRLHTPVEKMLIDIWEEVLGRRATVEDNFFEAGGDSIKAIQLAARLHAQGFKLQLKDIIQNPVIRELALSVRQVEQHADQAAVTGEVPLTPIQKYFFAPPRTDPHHYNQAVTLELEPGFTPQVLAQIFGKLLEHHDALRMLFRDEPDGVHQYNGGLPAQAAVRVFDFGDPTDPGVAVEAEALQRSLNLQSGPLLRAALFRFPQSNRLLIAVHHLVIDGVSWRILFEDLQALYAQLREGKPLQLPPKTDSFKLWSERLRRYADSPALLKEIPYWASIESTEVQPIPKDFAGGGNLEKHLTRLAFRLGRKSTRMLLTEANRAFNTEITDMLLAALALGAKAAFGTDRLLVLLEGHGREDIAPGLNVTRTVGWFTSLFPVILEAGSGEDVAYSLKEAKDRLRRVPNKGVGYGIVKYLTAAVHTAGVAFRHNPQVCFNYLGQFDADFRNRSFQSDGASTGQIRSPRAERDFELSVQGIIINHRLEISVTFSGEQYRKSTIKRLLIHYRQALLDLLAFCTAHEQRELTPSDFFYKELSNEELNSIFD
ncbi:MAG: LLM class flavin-dependent oxidoreductase, partial [Cytophagales bacterium]|nr:LLM class flavin-dependent oxidoreductase [Cytophagales bacterium]